MAAGTAQLGPAQCRSPVFGTASRREARRYLVGGLYSLSSRQQSLIIRLSRTARLVVMTSIAALFGGPSLQTARMPFPTFPRRWD
jgi:hypothetical protein